MQSLETIEASSSGSNVANGRALDDRSAIPALAEAILAGASLEEMLDSLCAWLLNGIGVDEAGAMLAHDAAARVIGSTDLRPFRVTEPDGALALLRRAAKGEGAFYCNDCSSESPFADLVEAGPEGTSLLAVIVNAGHGRIAAVWGIRRTIGGFDERDAAALEGFAMQASVWLVNRDLAAEELKARERLQRLHATVKKIARSPELDEILPQIVTDATNLLSASSGDMLLLDEERSVLMVVGICNLPEEMLNFEMPFGEGVSSRAMADRLPISVSDYPNYPHRARHLDPEAFKAVLSVPLVSRGKAIGAINVHRNEVGYRYDQDEIDLLMAFADHAAVAIDTARRYESEKALASHLSDLNAVMRRRNLDLTRALEVQNRLAQKVLMNQGLDEIVAELAALLRRPVIVHDHLMHVLSTSDADIAGHPGTDRMDEEAFASFLENLLASRKALPVPDEETTMMAPLLAGDDVLGYLSVLKTSDLREIDIALINLAITSLSLELVKVRIAIEVEQRVRGDLVLDLIEGTLESPEMMKARASYLGYSLDESYYLALLAISSEREERPGDTMRRRLHELVQRQATSLSPRNIAAETPHGIVLLLNDPPDGPDPISTLSRLTEILQDRFSDVQITSVLSERCSDPSDFRASFRLARETIEVLHKVGAASGVVDAREQGLFRLLLKASSRDELFSYANSLLEPIRLHDRERGSELERTLRLYLDSGGNQRKAASLGFLHANTVAYRLRRIEALLGRELGTAESVLELQLALRISDLLTPPGS